MENITKEIGVTSPSVEVFWSETRGAMAMYSGEQLLDVKYFQSGDRNKAIEEAKKFLSGMKLIR